MTTRTIPYSQFKTLVAQGRVAGLTISRNEITGRVIPLPNVKHPAGSTARAKTNLPAAGEI